MRIPLWRGRGAGPALVPALREDGPEGGEEAPLDGDGARKHEAQAPEEPELLLPTRPLNDVGGWAGHLRAPNEDCGASDSWNERLKASRSRSLHSRITTD